MGIYRLLKDGTCLFLAIDFDEDSWRKDVQTVRSVCLRERIPCSIEISRSGNSAHVWFFFSTPLPAKRARSLSSAILTKVMDEHARLKLSSYDRMFPNQDAMPKGGFGNLIALPFQIEAYKRGGCLFVDEQIRPYADQWAYLSTVERVSANQVDVLLSTEGTSLGVLKANPDQTDNEKSEPWKREDVVLAREDFPEKLIVTLADRLYILVEGLSDRAQNQIKRLAVFHNPEFFQAQAMRMPVWNKPRIIHCAEYTGDYLVLLRGCRDALEALLSSAEASVVWKDERSRGCSIHVSFSGELCEEQRIAKSKMIAHEDGILSATTAFGKTVIGAALIAEKKVSTLVLVHRRQLLEHMRSCRKHRKSEGTERKEKS